MVWLAMGAALVSATVALHYVENRRDMRRGGIWIAAAGVLFFIAIHLGKDITP